MTVGFLLSSIFNAWCRQASLVDTGGRGALYQVIAISNKKPSILGKRASQKAKKRFYRSSENHQINAKTA